MDEKQTSAARTRLSGARRGMVAGHRRGEPGERAPCEDGTDDNDIGNDDDDGGGGDDEEDVRARRYVDSKRQRAKDARSFCFSCLERER